MVDIVCFFCWIFDVLVSDEDLEGDARGWQCAGKVDAELFSWLRCDERCDSVSVFFECHVFCETFGCGRVVDPTSESVEFWYLRARGLVGCVLREIKCGKGGINFRSQVSAP